MATKKKTAEPKKISVKAKFKFNYYGKTIEKGEILELFDGDAKNLIDKGFAEKA